MFRVVFPGGVSLTQRMAAEIERLARAVGARQEDLEAMDCDVGHLAGLDPVVAVARLAAVPGLTADDAVYAVAATVARWVAWWQPVAACVVCGEVMHINNCRAHVMEHARAA